MSCLPKIKQASGVREALALTLHAVRGVEQELQVRDVPVDDCAHHGLARLLRVYGILSALAAKISDSRAEMRSLRAGASIL